MKKTLIAIAMLTITVFITACATNTENYLQFANTEFLAELLNNAPTRTEINDFNLDLINQGARQHAENMEMNRRIRERASTTTSRTTGTVWGPNGLQQVDLTTVETRHVPASELNLRPRVSVNNVYEGRNVPRSVVRNYFGRMSLHFATVGDMEFDRLYQVRLYDVVYFMGVDFSQFNAEEYNRERILEVLATTYGLDVEAERSRGLNNPIMALVVYYDNLQIEIRSPEHRGTRIYISLLGY